MATVYQKKWQGVALPFLRKDLVTGCVPIRTHRRELFELCAEKCAYFFQPPLGFCLEAKHKRRRVRRSAHKPPSVFRVDARAVDIYRFVTFLLEFLYELIDDTILVFIRCFELDGRRGNVVGGGSDEFR